MWQNLNSDFTKNAQLQENVNRGQSQACQSLFCQRHVCEEVPLRGSDSAASALRGVLQPGLQGSRDVPPGIRRRLPDLSSTRTHGAEMQLLLPGEGAPVSFLATPTHEKDSTSLRAQAGPGPRLSPLTAGGLRQPRS